MIAKLLTEEVTNNNGQKYTYPVRLVLIPEDKSDQHFVKLASPLGVEVESVIPNVSLTLRLCR